LNKCEVQPLFGQFLHWCGRVQATQMRTRMTEHPIEQERYHGSRAMIFPVESFRFLLLCLKYSHRSVIALAWANRGSQSSVCYCSARPFWVSR
jgi:hypothetical protein